MEKHRIICLTIGGFDPSGGAGIIADCKVFEQHKVQGMAIQTCNTIQTEDSFETCEWSSEVQIMRQLEVLLKRYSIQNVKIGLIENSKTLLAIVTRLKQIPKMTIVWDPVLTPSAGGDMRENRFNTEIAKILSCIDLVTPNLPEFEQLFNTQNELIIPEKVKVYLKGGHAKDIGKDTLHWKGNTYPFRLNTKNCTNKHGSGCILSSAILANMAKGYPTIKGLRKAKDYTERCLSSNSTGLSYHKF
jgi:hydroxymethylpyrimidine/phosphomethylpyrimidine kinase